VRWKVASRRFNRGFAVKALADAFRAQLLEAARKGESFSTETGLPQSLARRERHVTFHADIDQPPQGDELTQIEIPFVVR